MSEEIVSTDNDVSVLSTELSKVKTEDIVDTQLAKESGNKLWKAYKESLSDLDIGGLAKYIGKTSIAFGKHPIVIAKRIAKYPADKLMRFQGKAITKQYLGYTYLDEEALQGEQLDLIKNYGITDEDLIMPNSNLCEKKKCSGKKLGILLCNENRKCVVAFKKYFGNWDMVEGDASELMNDKVYDAYMEMHDKEEIFKGYRDYLHKEINFTKNMAKDTYELGLPVAKDTAKKVGKKAVEVGTTVALEGVKNSISSQSTGGVV